MVAGPGLETSSSLLYLVNSTGVVRALAGSRGRAGHASRGEPSLAALGTGCVSQGLEKLELATLGQKNLLGGSWEGSEVRRSTAEDSWCD